MAVPVKSSAVVLGHSFVKGLDDHYRHRFMDFNPQLFPSLVAGDLMVDHNIQNVFLYGRSGAKIDVFEMPNLFLSMVHPSIVVIDLGTNDICQGINPYVSATTLFAMATDLVSKFQSFVFLCSVLPRVSSLGILSSVDEFNSLFREFNSYIFELCKNSDQIFYHSHRGFWEILDEDGNKSELPVESWSNDGIHPNNIMGRHKYKNSLRNVLSRGVKFVNNLPEKYWEHNEESDLQFIYW